MNLDILDRITVLLDGKDQKELTEYLGLKNVAFSEWKSGKSKSYRKYLIEIANFFNVSIDYLVYGKESTGAVSDDVRELLSYYSNLSDIDRGKLLGKAEALVELAAERAAAEQLPKAKRNAALTDAQSAPQKPEHTDEFYIDLCSLPASAGTGVQLDESYTEPLRIEHTPIAERANYAVRVSGNSMEDKYYDGDIVLIETCPEVELGEIGLFIVNDKGYIKKRGEDRLISLNPDSPDVTIREGDVVYCRGRVLGKAEIIK